MVRGEKSGKRISSFYTDFSLPSVTTLSPENLVVTLIFSYSALCGFPHTMD